MQKIITTLVNPPIPIRSFDWSAHYDGDEEGFVGRGSTEQEAAAELLEIANGPVPEIKREHVAKLKSLRTKP